MIGLIYSYDSTTKEACFARFGSQITLAIPNSDDARRLNSFINMVSIEAQASVKKELLELLQDTLATENSKTQDLK